MFRVPALVSVTAVALLGLVLAAGRTPPTVAQEATPAAGEVAVELLGHGPPSAAPGFDLSLYRVTLAPCAAVPPHTHPGATVVSVEAGTLAFTPPEAEARLVRAGTGATPGAEARCWRRAPR